MSRRCFGLVVLTSAFAIGCGTSDTKARQQQQLRCFINNLSSKDADRQEAAVEGLGRLKDKAGIAVPSLAQLLANPRTDGELRETILATLSEIGPPASAAVPAIMQAIALQENLEAIGRLTLSRLGPEGEVELLRVLQTHSDWRARRHALRLATVLTHATTERVLSQSLADDTRGEAREAAAMTLGERMVTESIPQLATALRDAYWPAALAAAHALHRLGGRAASYLEKALLGRHAGASLAAATALPHLPDRTADALPIWLKALSDNRWQVRAAAARAIGKLGVNNDAAILPALNKLLTDSSIEVQEAAEDALSRISPDNSASP